MEHTAPNPPEMNFSRKRKAAAAVKRHQKKLQRENRKTQRCY